MKGQQFFGDISQGVPGLRHFLRVCDLDSQELGVLLRLARKIKDSKDQESARFVGRSVACIFEKPSTRTRLSIAVAAHRLGMAAHVVEGSELQLARGETINDTGRAISQYVDLIVFRTFAHRRLEELAEGSQVPVINGLSNDHHPCQALADLLTIEERLGSLHGRKVAFVGDSSSNIAHSLLEAAALSGMVLSIASPRRYNPDPSIVARAQELAQESGGAIQILEDPYEAVDNADVVYPETWVPMDRESERSRRAGELARYKVDRDLMSRAKSSAIFLHCLPAFRGQEVTEDVLDAPYSAVWQQAENRLPTSQALMLWLLSKR